MKKNQSRKFTSKFKTQVVLEALREGMTLNQLADKFDLNKSQISSWKKSFLENAHLAFEAEMVKEKIAEANENELKMLTRMVE
jgi:transposase